MLAKKHTVAFIYLPVSLTASLCDLAGDQTLNRVGFLCVALGKRIAFSVSSSLTNTNRGSAYSCVLPSRMYGLIYGVVMVT